MTLNDAIAQLDAPIRLWIMWLGLVMLICPIVMMLFRGARRTGAIILAVNILAVVLVNLLHMRFGFVRLLGLGHVVVWVPLLVWLLPKLRGGAMHRVARAALLVLFVTLAVSLAFDIVDVARWLLGERAPMLPVPA